MRPSLIPLLAAAVLLPAGVLLAQDAGPEPSRRHRARAPQSAPDLSQVASVSGVGGTLHAVAAGWRATFADDGSVDFEPALGRSAARAASWRMRLGDVRRGGEALLDTAGAAPRTSHDRKQATHHWRGADERFVATPAGLKHSVVLDQRPGGDGDLVVRCRVDSPLAPAGGGDADGLRWTYGDGNGVQLGAVVGVDAQGRRCAGAARFVPGGFELSLPDAFVDAATFPLEVDPLIGVVRAATPALDVDFPDVAYDAYSDSWCVAFTQFLGGGGTSVVATVWDADTMAYGYGFAVTQTGDEDSVRVTNVAGTGLFALVWVNYGATNSSICGLAFEPVQVQATSVFTIDGPAALGAPTVSGEATLFDDDFLCVWQEQGFGLLGCTVAIGANMQVTATPIQALAGPTASEPALSKQGGNPGVHVLAWIDRPLGLPGRVRAQAFTHDLVPIGAGVFVQNGAQDCAFPAVDGDGAKFLVAWEEQEAANPSALDVRGKLLTVGPSGFTTIGSALPLVVTPNDLDYAVDVALLGDKFGVCWMGNVGTAANGEDCWFRAVNGVGATIGAELRLDVTPGSVYRYEHSPRLIGRIAGDATLPVDDGLCVFADQNVNTFDSDVGLQQVEAMGQGGAITDLGGGCGPGGLAGSPGPAALGNTALALELFGAQPLAIPFLFLGLPGPPTTCGVCTIIQPIVVHFVPNYAGSATFPFAVPGTATLVGFQFDCQYVSLNVAYVGCPALPGAAASNIVRLALAY
ncbi:MAG: hypothetical protein ACK5AL_09330 [Planctomycetota bacterium]